MTNLLDPLQTSYRPRGRNGNGPVVQAADSLRAIPITDDNGPQIFAYKRGKGQGEQRLHSKISVGIGGHISSIDSQASGDETYREGMARELEEEVIIDTPYTERIVGLINDDETEVGKVHLGIVHIFEVEKPNVRSREEDILEAGFRPIGELLTQLDQMETWSSICLKALFGEN